MTQIAIRQSGGANIISIPKTILKILNLHVGSTLELHLEGNKIVLVPVSEKFSLQILLEGSPKERLQIMDEDKEWLNEPPVGKEI
jgi:antitoxin ChpS